MIQDNITFDLPVNFGIPFESSQDIYGDEKVETLPVEVNGVTYDVVSWGKENQLPYKVKKKIGANGVMAQNKYFNMLTSYGRGLEYIDVATINDKKPLPTRDAGIRKFLLRNSMKEFFAEQIVDMKYYFFAVSVVILDRQRENIVKIVHKEACHCRFEKADEKGHIKHVFFADWERKSGKEYARRLLEMGVNTIWCMNDLMAAGAYDAIIEAGLAVGKDISVFGFDNREVSEFMTPMLSTCELPLKKMGETCAELMIKEIEDEDFRKQPAYKTMVPCELVLRDSVR